MQYTSLIYLLALVSLVCGNRDDLWHEWKRVHRKNYNDADETTRRMQWERNVDQIQTHNLRHDLGLETYTMGLNQFTDLSWEEFKRDYLTEMPSNLAVHDSLEDSFLPNTNDDVPESLDWREKGIVTPVKNQGGCGSCWAFSTVAVVESQYIKTFNETKLFSEQQLVDCSARHGCHGGFMEAAYHYLQSKALETQSNYPYHAREEQCHYEETKGLVKVSTFKTVHNGNEEQLKNLVANFGPAAVAINADHGFQMYKSGVYTSKTCKAAAVNHAVVVVGYGTQSGTDYWIVRNSWGAWWGAQGYILFARNHQNMCGIASWASVPQIVKSQA